MHMLNSISQMGTSFAHFVYHMRFILLRQPKPEATNEGAEFRCAQCSWVCV